MCNLRGRNSVVTLFAARFSFCTVGERLQTCLKRVSITTSPHISFVQHAFVTDCFKGSYNIFRNIYNTQNSYISYRKLVSTARKKADPKTVRHGPRTRGQPACIMRPTAIFVNHVYTKIYKLPAICSRAASGPTLNSRCVPSPYEGWRPMQCTWKRVLTLILLTWRIG